MTMLLDKLGHEIQDFSLNTALNRMDGVAIKNITGQNKVAITGEWNDCSFYLDKIQHMPGTEAIQLVKFSPNDLHPSGTGARVVYVSGLDENGEDVSERFELTASTTNGTQQFSAINSMTVTEAGSLGTNDSTILARPISDATIELNAIEGKQTRSDQGAYWVPKGKTFVLTGFAATIESTSSLAWIDGRVVFNPGNNVYVPLAQARFRNGGTSADFINLPTYASFDYPTHVKYQFKSESSNYGSSCNMLGFLITNEKISRH